MSTYTIGEAAGRSGFAASTLRYYDDIGLQAPAGRSEAGYRRYDDGDLARLAFIAQAKRLGCTLSEITELVGVADGAECAPVQQRLHHLVVEKVDTTQRQASQLIALAARLRSAADRLSEDPIEGPCTADCACLLVHSGPVASAAAAPAPTGAVAEGDPLISCSLDPGAMPARRADWQAILGQAQGRTAAADGGLRVEFGDDVSLGDLARLVAAEQTCCAFFGFCITVDRRGIGLEVRAPEAAADLVEALFGG
ncbi:MAG: MerR family transcriptional regulator [Actinomycetota bacterium]|nr:MerR family transcriptional regulator [Actinomycetota bacterium]